MNAPVPSLPAATLAESPVAASPAFTRGQVLRVLSGILLCMLLSAIDQNVVVPAVPAIAADLNSYSHLAWIVSAYLLTSTAATPIYGKLPISMAGARCCCRRSSGSSSLPCCADSPAAFPSSSFSGRCRGSAGVDCSSWRRRRSPTSWPRASAADTRPISRACGPPPASPVPCSRWVTDAASWRWIFWLNVPIGAAAFVLSDRALKMLKARRLEARVDYAGAALLTIAITARC